MIKCSKDDRSSFVMFEKNSSKAFQRGNLYRVFGISINSIPFSYYSQSFTIQFLKNIHTRSCINDRRKEISYINMEKSFERTFFFFFFLLNINRF
ncbi:hypothetical protein V1478_015418 [Vespula squamosa]|uniref:Uncharacterized protein n=1 Tax=Vespula squamosa TaxID=30214 RepID=A0ABD2A7F1_VESSQ